MERRVKKLFLSAAVVLCCIFFLGKKGTAGYITPTYPGFAPNHNGKIAKSLVLIPGAKAVGNSACWNCHPQPVDPDKLGLTPKGWKLNIHSEIPGTSHCEYCHGNASLHVADNAPVKINNIAAWPPAKINALCETCHFKGQSVLHAGAHLDCLNCHSFHADPMGNKYLLKYAVERDVCYQCHLRIKAEFNMFSHHPVNEGLMSCTDCHKPHFSSKLTMLKNAPQVFGARRSVEACGTCHPAEAGPFVFSHSTTAGCLACHSPHGSPQEFLWRLPQPALCLRCHTGSSLQYSVMAQDCTACHPAIHGSNSSRNFFTP